MKSPKIQPTPSSCLVNIIECRRPGGGQPLLRQFAQILGTRTTKRTGVESQSWQFVSSSQIQVVEMRHTQEITSGALRMEIPSVVLVVYDPADHDSMHRVTDLLAMEPSVWLPQAGQLALASSGSATVSPWPVRRLKARAKRHMGTLQVFDILSVEATMNLLQWTLVVASTHKVACLEPPHQLESLFEPDRPGTWSKLLRKVASKVTLKSATDSTEAREPDSPSTLLRTPDEQRDTVTRPSTAPNIP